jgi:lysozyme
VKVRRGAAGRCTIGIEVALSMDEAGTEAPKEPGAEDDVVPEEEEEEEETAGIEEEEEEEEEEPKGRPEQAKGRLQLSNRGAQFIARFEGIRRKLYNDPAGHCTIGVGHLVHRGNCNGREPAVFKRGITRARAYALLRRDATKAANAVRRLGVPLNQHQFDALVSFTFNLGPGWTTKSGLRRALLARRYKDVPHEMSRWIYAGGKPLPGLIRRRRAEGQLFRLGKYA